MIAVVIVVIPIAFRVPAMLAFIPPPMGAVPAALPLRAQSPACVFGLPALGAMPCHSLVQPMVRARNPTLAIMFVGSHKRHRGEHQKASKHGRRKYGFPDE